MTFDINFLEGVWSVLCLIAAFFVLMNLIDAFQDWRSVRGTSKAWRVQALANFRREAIQLVKVVALVVIVLPALLRPGESELSWLVVALMVLPIGIATNSILDARTRRTLERLLANTGG